LISDLKGEIFSPLLYRLSYFAKCRLLIREATPPKKLFIDAFSVLEHFCVNESQSWTQLTSTSGEIEMKDSWNREYIKVNRDGTTGKWHVDGVLPHRDKNGKRKRCRKRFDTQAQADRYAESQRDLGEHYLTSGQTRRTRLTEIEEADAINAIKLIEQKFKGEGRTLTDSALFFIDQFSNFDKNVKLGDAIAAYLTNPKLVKKSEAHKKQFRRRLVRFEKAYGSEVTLDSFSAEDIEDWIYDDLKDVSDTERRNEYACIHAFFNWCLKKNKVIRNVVSVVDKPDATERVPQALSIPEVETLFEWAQKIDAGSTVPFFALATFAAIRPSEVLRLKWEDFNWDQNVIAVDGKGKRRRSVDLPKTCVKWLKPYIVEEGDVAPQNIRKLFDLVRALAGYRLRKKALYGVDKEGYDELVENCDSDDRPKWINDVLRHTGITYYQKQIQHIGKVAAWAGNSVSVIDSHYRAVTGVTDKTNKQFWALKPSN